jgi:protein-tyrosine phosphatase
MKMKILFVCSGNACRSPIAEALFKKINQKIQVESAGTNSHYRIVEITKDYAEKENVKQYLKEIPESIYEKKLESYDLIVAMESRHKNIILNKCPSCEGKVILWNVDDPYFVSKELAEEIFNKIKRKVIDLNNSI